MCARLLSREWFEKHIKTTIFQMPFLIPKKRASVFFLCRLFRMCRLYLNEGCCCCIRSFISRRMLIIKYPGCNAANEISHKNERRSRSWCVAEKRKNWVEKRNSQHFLELNANNVCIGTPIITLLLQGGIHIIMISEGGDRQPTHGYGWAQVPKTWF